MEISPQRLQQVEELASVPTYQLQWLIDNGEMVHYKKGDAVFKPGDPIDHLIIMLAGEMNFYVTSGANQKLINVMKPNHITGLLPFSRLSHAQGSGIVGKDLTIYQLHRNKLADMIRDHFELTQALVHFMTSRVREFSLLQSQNEKLMALGKLSAGLAHELNNPASAMVRSADSLQKHLKALPENFKAVMNIKITADEVDAVNDVLFNKIDADKQEKLSLIARTEKEEELGTWLEDYDIEDGFEIAENLVDFGFELKDLEDLFEICGEDHFKPVLGWINNNLITEKMVEEIKDASQRIAGLIQSVKSYSYMDRDQDQQPVDIHAGIQNTLTMLQHKLGKVGHQVKLSLGEALPNVLGMPGELNQVWTNLIDNAADAMGENPGTLEISTCGTDKYVQVNIMDTGPGIPQDLKTKIFEPFYTTKEMGKGTGLGLDIVRKIIHQHDGTIKVDSQPGKTDFEIRFPLKTASTIN